jgi:hypothetical protein
MSKNMACVTRTSPRAIVGRTVAAAGFMLVALLSSRLPAIASNTPSRPRIRLRPVGLHRLIPEGGVVDFHWRSHGLAEQDVAIQVSRDEGTTWAEVGRSPEATEGLSWTVAGPLGPATVRAVTSGTATASRPYRIQIVAGVAEICIANQFAASRMTDGTVRVWGTLPSDTLYPKYVYRPTELAGLVEITEVAAGGSHLLAVRSDGEVLLWGDPDGDANPQPPFDPPYVLSNVHDALFARAYFGTSFVRLTNGRVLAWGSNTFGSLGDGTNVPRPDPTEIPSLEGVSDIALGHYFGFALRPDGSVLAWGNNESGVLADGTTADNYTPATVAGLTDIVTIAAGFDYALALDRSGRVFSWGRDHFHQLGRDAPGVEGVPGATSAVPTQIPDLVDVIAIACDVVGGHAATRDGTLFGWGANAPGMVGDGTYEVRPRPVGTRLSHVSRVYGGITMTIHAVVSSGYQYAWGADYSQMVGNGRYGGSRNTPTLVAPWVRRHGT